MSMRTLSYLPSINRFMDADAGYIVHNLVQFFDTWQLDDWKRIGLSGQITDKNGELWELEYLNDEEEESAFEFMSWNESFGLQMERLNLI